MLDWFRRLLTPPPDAPDTRRVFSVGGTWGNRIAWEDFLAGTVSGHMSPRPALGDILISRMRSGKILVLRFTHLEYLADPPDMFFGRVKPVGYVCDLTDRRLVALLAKYSDPPAGLPTLL